MTQHEARVLPAGRELDQYVAAMLDRMKRPLDNEHSRWSSDVRAICSLCDELTSLLMKDEPWEIYFTCRRPDYPGREGMEKKWSCVLEGIGWSAEGEGPTMALAFCRAFIHEQEAHLG